jgi:hypothetical protein
MPPEPNVAHGQLADGQLGEERGPRLGKPSNDGRILVDHLPSVRR